MAFAAPLTKKAANAERELDDGNSAMVRISTARAPDQGASPPDNKGMDCACTIGFSIGAVTGSSTGSALIPALTRRSPRLDLALHGALGRQKEVLGELLGDRGAALS